MNIALKKLAMLEKSFAEQEEIARIQGYTTVVIDTEFRKSVRDLMDKVKFVI